MSAIARKELPAGYHLCWRFDLNQKKELIWVNVVGLALLILSGIGFAGLAHALRPQEFSTLAFWTHFSNWRSLLIVAELIAVTLIMLVIHEGLHGLFFWIFSGARPHFAFKIAYAYAAAPDWYFPRGKYVLISLAPLLGITLLGVLGLIYLPQPLLLPLYLLLVFNTSGAVGDLWVAMKMVTCPPGTYAHDCGDSIEFFGQLSD